MLNPHLINKGDKTRMTKEDNDSLIDFVGENFII